jgi:sulfate adenylyltransferase subunit 1 (EFTu-like GTPase family)
VWFSPHELTTGRRVLVRHTSREVPAIVKAITYRLDLGDLTPRHGVTHLEMNEIGRVSLKLAGPVVCDAYRRCRPTGAFIMIDEATNATLGAGLIS